MRARNAAASFAILALLLPFHAQARQTQTQNQTQNQTQTEPPVRRLLHVAVPGIRDYLEFGGHGLLVFDIDDGHKFLKRLPIGGLSPDGVPRNVKGVCASLKRETVYISTPEVLMAVDIRRGGVLWERAYDGGCDRMAISPDESLIYLPSFERDHWHVVSPDDGRVIARIEPKSGAHNTVFGPDGRVCYLAGLRSPLLSVADARKHEIVAVVGPFGAPVRPFTVNGAQTRVYVNVNELLGFEIGDLTNGRFLRRVEVPGFAKGPVKRHGCPSHGVGITPDESQIWLCDAHNQRLHVFQLRGDDEPKLLDSIRLREEPGWITFSIDGKYAYPSTGEVVEVATRRIVAALADERGRPVMSEKMLQIDFQNDRPVRKGDQFGLGAKR